MSKLSQLQLRKLQEIERDTEFKNELSHRKRAQNQKTGILQRINLGYLHYYDFPNNSGGEQLCLMLVEQNHGVNSKQRAALQRLTYTLLNKGWASWLNDGRIVNALAAVAKYENTWQNDLTAYKPISHNAYREFAHLLRYLFAEYPIPVFLDTAFYYQNDTHIRWYLHLARGGSVRTLDNMPLHLTQKMRHYFLQAPAEATIPQALRYAQVLGLGGSRRLARLVMQTRLGENFDNEVFWETVLVFLVQNQMLDPVYVPSIIDFLQYMKYENQEVIDENGRTQYLPAPDHAFSMKGRTVVALLRLVEIWEIVSKKAATPKTEAPNWNGLPLPDFSWTEGEGLQSVTYRIKQIRTIYALREEGRIMSHCVATYCGSCINGVTSIWSMSCEDACGNSKRLITIELNKALQIQQARGNCNYMPEKKAYELLLLWANRYALRLSADVAGYEANLPT